MHKLWSKLQQGYWYDTVTLILLPFTLQCISLTNPSFQLISRSEPSDRIGTSKYRKMYKDLMSKSEKASCLKLANGHRLWWETMAHSHGIASILWEMLIVSAVWNREKRYMDMGWKWMKMDEMGMRCRRADELVGSRQQELAGLKGEEVLKLKSVILPHNCGRYLHSQFRTTLENFPRCCLLFPTWGAWCELTGRREAVGVCAPGLFELHRTVKFEHAKLRLMKELGVSAPQYWSQDQQTWKVHEHSSRSVMSVHYDT